MREALELEGAEDDCVGAVGTAGADSFDAIAAEIDELDASDAVEGFAAADSGAVDVDLVGTAGCAEGDVVVACFCNPCICICKCW